MLASVVLAAFLLRALPDPPVLLPDSMLVVETSQCPDDDEYEPDDTPATAHRLSDQPETHRHCDPDWLRLPASAGSTWAIETRSLRGGADTVIELYEQARASEPFRRTARDDDSGQAGGSRLVVRLIGDQPYVGVFEAGGAYGPGKSYEVVATCLSLCGAVRHVSVLPALFQGGGVTRPDLSSDVLLSNPSFAEVTAELVLSASTASRRLRRTVTVGPGATLTLPSLISTTFGLPQAEASLEIRPQGELLASAVLRDAAGRIVDVSKAEPIEGSLAAASESRSDSVSGVLAAAETGHLLQLEGRPFVPLSIGLVETTGGTSTVTVRLLDALGVERDQRIVVLAPNGVSTLSFGDGPTQRGAVRATVEVRGGGVLAYALATETATSRVLLSPLRVSRGDSLPATAREVTDVRVLNVGSETRSASLTFSSGGGSVPVPFSERPLAPGETLVLEDALSALSDVGDGLLRASSPDLMISARGRASGSTPAPLRPFGLADPAALGAGRGRLSLTLPPGTRALTLVAEHETVPLTLTASLVGADGLTRGTAEVPFGGACGPGSSPCVLTSADLLADLGIPEEGSRLDVEGPAESLGLAARVTLAGPSSHYAVPVPLGEGLETFAYTLSRSPALVLRRVPAGTFWMGSPEDEEGRDGDELRHRVTITQPFLIGEREISRAQWQDVLGYPSATPGPIDDIGWNDIAASDPGGFLNLLNAHAARTLQAQGLRFRMPSEAEWEKAARGGTTTPFPFPLPPSCDLTTSSCSAVCVGQGQGTPGVLDMSGSVWEWVADRYGPYDPDDRVDPHGPPAGELRVVRGGSARTALKLCRSANRFGYPPTGKYPDVGFRVALAPPGPLRVDVAP